MIVKACKDCGEDFVLQPGKPGLASVCPDCTPGYHDVPAPSVTQPTPAQRQRMAMERHERSHWIRRSADVACPQCKAQVGERCGCRERVVELIQVKQAGMVMSNKVRLFRRRLIPAKPVRESLPLVPAKVPVGPPRIVGYFDGGCWPNPHGHAAWGAILEVDGVIVKRWNGYIGSGQQTSNNVAEYYGLIAVLREVARYSGPAIVYGDSLMVIRQMQKFRRAKSCGIYVPWNHEALRLLEGMRDRVRFQWIPREQNTECDRLAEAALRGKKRLG